MAGESLVIVDKPRSARDRWQHWRIVCTRVLPKQLPSRASRPTAGSPVKKTTCVARFLKSIAEESAASSLGFQPGTVLFLSATIEAPGPRRSQGLCPHDQRRLVMPLRIEPPIGE